MSYTGELPARTLLKVVRSPGIHHFQPIYVRYQGGNIDGVNVSGRCLRTFSESLQECSGSRISGGCGEPHADSDL